MTKQLDIIYQTNDLAEEFKEIDHIFFERRRDKYKLIYVYKNFLEYVFMKV